MFRTFLLAWLLFACQRYGAAASPNWPSAIDDLEDLMLLNTGYRARGFAAPVIPCSSTRAAGRITAAEWLRTAFHDMATGSVYTGIGGMDASVVFESDSGENIGPFLQSSLTTYAPFLSSRTSMADLIALGVTSATRSCGGPTIPLRGGRVDATAAGPIGVPLPQNPVGTFKNQFLRMGYNTSEMVAFTACGHSLGGVHSSNFPDIVPANTAPDGFVTFDTTPNIFDNKVASEFVSGTTKNPMVVGPSIAKSQNADTKVYGADGNVTIKALASSPSFADTCKTMFQRMLELVPTGVTLTDPIQPYDIKPYDLQLTLLDGGLKILFTGDIRIRTTSRPASQIALVQLLYKDRTGATVSTSIATTHSGDATGFDDTFSFYGFSAQLPADTSISSFNVLVTLAGGNSETWDNNGNSFMVDDTVIFQSPQSCLDASGNLTIAAAVRNGGAAPNLQVVVKNPRPSPVVVPALSTSTAAMASQSSVGSYQLFAGSVALSGSQAQSAIFGVSLGSSSDNYKNATLLPSKCAALRLTAPTSTPLSSAFAFQGCYSDNGPRALSASNTASDTMSVESCAVFCGKTYALFGLEYGRECYCGNELDSSSVIMGLTDCNMACSGNANETCGAASRLSLYENLHYSPPVVAQVSGYNYLGCYSEGSSGRALSDSGTTSDNMTAESCAAYCSGYAAWGVEYGRECYCGNAINAGSTIQSASDCNMLCSGNSSEFCGAGNRLNLYQRISVSTSSPSQTPTPTSTSISSTSNILSSSNSLAATSSNSTATLTTTIVPLNTTTTLTSTLTTHSSSSPLITSAELTTTALVSLNSSSGSSSTLVFSSSSSLLANSIVVSSSLALNGSSTASSLSSMSSASGSSNSNSTSPPTSTPSATTSFGLDSSSSAPSTSSSKSLIQSSSSSFTPTPSTTTLSSSMLPTVLNSSNIADVSSSAPANTTIVITITPIPTPSTISSNLVSPSVPSSNSLTPSLNATFITSSGSATTVPSATASPSRPSLTGYTYLGCKNDTVGNRALAAFATASDNNTYASCAETCTGYEYWATEYSRECYCGYELSNNPINASESDCNMPCTGDSTEVCGGPSRINLFQSNTIITSPSNPIISDYKYKGCHFDSVGTRALNGSFFFDDEMTVTKCATFCQGSEFFGLEYSSECYCSDANGDINTQSAPESDCSFICSGNKDEFCGAGDRLSLWQRLSNNATTSS